MIDYSLLREIQKKEISSSALAKLDDDFYLNVSKLLTEKQLELRKSNSILAIKEYENLKKLITIIQARREEKIVLLAVRGERTNPNLTEEESEMLREIFDIVEKYRNKILLNWQESDSTRRIKILKHVEQYKGENDVVYGPFNEGEEHSLPLKEAEWLIRSNMAKII